MLRLPLLSPLLLLSLLVLPAAGWLRAGEGEEETDSPRTNRPSSAVARVLRLNPPAPPQPGAPINDRALGQFLERQGTNLVLSGVALTNWDELLDARTHQLKLPSPSSRRLDVAEAVRRIEAAVAVVGTFYDCGKCSRIHMSTASGFFITADGAFVTCRHVLSSYRTNGHGMAVLTRDGRVCPVTAVLACDPLHDVIVLQVAGTGFKALPLARKDASPGTPVTVVSHPSQRFFAVSTGILARQAEENREDGLYRFASITADFAKGSSGAPVCDPTGAVVGIVNNTQSIYYSVESGQPQNFQMAVKNCTPVSALRAILPAR
jgi:serine protease Do